MGLSREDVLSPAVTAVGLRLQWFSMALGTLHFHVAHVSQGQRTPRTVFNAQRAARVPPQFKGDPTWSTASQATNRTLLPPHT